MDAGREQELLERCRHDPGAFAELYDENFEQIFHYILHRISNVPLAEDLTSQTFEKAVRKIGRFRWRGISVTAWLYRVASNEVNSYLRKQYRKKRFERPWSEHYTAVDSRSPDHELEAAEAEVSRHELFARVADQLKRLGRLDQTILTLRYFEGKSYREIAEILGKREGTMRMRASRALGKLRGLLSQEDIGHERYRETAGPDYGAVGERAVFSSEASEPTA